MFVSSVRVHSGFVYQTSSGKLHMLLSYVWRIILHLFAPSKAFYQITATAVVRVRMKRWKW